MVYNAVAPDWNLKTRFEGHNAEALRNAVAPDWNLKHVKIGGMRRKKINAVAPDWNLKLAREQCNGCPYR